MMRYLLLGTVVRKCKRAPAKDKTCTRKNVLFTRFSRNRSQVHSFKVKQVKIGPCRMASHLTCFSFHRIRSGTESQCRALRECVKKCQYLAHGQIVRKQFRED